MDKLFVDIIKGYSNIRYRIHIILNKCNISFSSLFIVNKFELVIWWYKAFIFHNIFIGCINLYNKYDMEYECLL